ncbi:MAG: hypothetical protein ACTSPQ_14565 [Candidatus Helarchaeota archaeon]
MTRISILIRLENWIDNFDDLFLNPDEFTFRNSSIDCKWNSFKPALKIDKNKKADKNHKNHKLFFKNYKKVGYGCTKLGCDGRNLINWINMHDSKIQKIRKIKKFRSKPSWLNKLFDLYESIISKSNKMNINEIKRLTYKCRALGDIILIFDTKPYETILTSNVKDFNDICRIFKINLIKFERI